MTDKQFDALIFTLECIDNTLKSIDDSLTHERVTQHFDAMDSIPSHLSEISDKIW